jgi:hypothetical protein
MSARDRWDAFLNQIESRHAELVREAFEGAKEALPDIGFDTSPVGVALGAVRSRLLDLESRIDDTWNEKVDDAFGAEGVGHEERAWARERGAALKRRLERERERLEPHAFAHAAHAIHRRTLAHRSDVVCANCGAPLSPPVTYRAIEVRCRTCSAVGLFQPSPLMRQVEAIGSHAIAWVASEAEWLAMLDTQDRVRAARSPCPLALLQAYEEAQIVYWRKYFHAKAQMIPEIAADVEANVRSRLQHWYMYSADHEQEWVRAGRPCRMAISV